jgi:hypothetical protein
VSMEDFRNDLAEAARDSVEELRMQGVDLLDPERGGVGVVQGPTSRPRTRAVAGADLIGQTIGDLIVLRSAPRQVWKTKNAEFRCKNTRTGETETVRGDVLRRRMKRAGT